MKLQYGKWYFYFEFKNNWHFCPFNWIETVKFRFVGYRNYYYDGDNHTFGFWFFNMTWGYV